MVAVHGVNSLGLTSTTTPILLPFPFLLKAKAIYLSIYLSVIDCTTKWSRVLQHLLSWSNLSLALNTMQLLHPSASCHQKMLTRSRESKDAARGLTESEIGYAVSNPFHRRLESWSQPTVAELLAIEHLAISLPVLFLDMFYEEILNTNSKRRGHGKISELP